MKKREPIYTITGVKIPSRIIGRDFKIVDHSTSRVRKRYNKQNPQAINGFLKRKY